MSPGYADGESSQDKITSPAIHKSSRNVACEQSTLFTVHDSEDRFNEGTVNSNMEQEVIEEHYSPDSADAVNSPPVEIGSYQHHKAATVPPEGRDSDHQDVSSNVQQGSRRCQRHMIMRLFILLGWQIFHQLDLMVR